ncbi:MAG: DNA repair protein RecO [SAR324 cluster bacterium]|nr:DNA repair protein RecO [SAR324 cluster bacterium]MBL7034379.1 DNA repair protein RecO [SAR324 cluster bacterium]
MKVIETAGIVLKTMDFKENDIILTILTREAGKKSGIFHGGKSLRSGNAAKAELFVINYFEYSEKPNTDLVRIRKCELLESFPPLRKNYSKFLHANYFSEILLQCEISGVDSQDYFELLKNTMFQLSGAKTGAEIKFDFEMQLLKLLGVHPNLDNCIQCASYLWKNEHGRITAPKYSVPYQLDARLGGIRCPECCIQSSYTAVLHPGSLAFFSKRQTALQSDSGIRPTQINLKELDQALAIYFRHYFGKNLKTHTLLQENSWKN